MFRCIFHSNEKRPAIAWLVAGLLVVMPSVPATAQEDGEDEELEEEFELLAESAEVVVSAAKHEQKIGFSPSAVVVIGRKEIEASGATTLAELLRRWPITHVYEFDPMLPFIDVRTEIKILMLIDGREINLELFSSPFYNALPIGLQEIERIEIVLGPNSAIYGANAVAAVLNIITRRPLQEPSAEATVAAGEHGGLELDLWASGGTGPLTLKLSGGLGRSDSWMQVGQNAKDIWRADGWGELRLGEVTLDLKSGFGRGEGRFFSILGIMEMREMWLAHAETTLKVRDFSFRSYWYGMRGEMNIDVGLYHPALGIELGRLPLIRIAGDTVHNEAQLNLQPGSGNFLVLGADARYTRYHSLQLVDDTVAEVRAGAYFHDEQRLGDDWLLQAGLRYDFNSRTEWALSPRGAIIYHLADEHYFRLSGGLAFRKPSLLETSMNFEIVPNPAFPEVEELFENRGISNPALGNELLSSIEVGWRGSWLDGRLKTSLDAYAAFNRHVIEFTIDIAFDDSPLGPRLNVEKSHIGYEDLDMDTDVFGAYLSLEAKPLDWLEFFARLDLRYSIYTERGNIENPWNPDYIAAVGITLADLFSLHGQAVFYIVGDNLSALRHPESALLPSVVMKIPTCQYLTLFLGRRFEVGRMRLETGLSFFNAFNKRFREEKGMIAESGVNFGSELLGRRLMALLRLEY